MEFIRFDLWPAKVTKVKILPISASLIIRWRVTFICVWVQGKKILILFWYKIVLKNTYIYKKI